MAEALRLLDDSPCFSHDDSSMCVPLFLVSAVMAVKHPVKLTFVYLLLFVVCSMSVLSAGSVLCLWLWFVTTCQHRFRSFLPPSKRDDEFYVQHTFANFNSGVEVSGCVGFQTALGMIPDLA